MMTCKERYQNDPVFQRLVDLMQYYLEENDCRQYTPTELREAVMLAATMYEYRHIRPIVIDCQDPYRLPVATGNWERPRHNAGKFGPSSGRVRTKQHFLGCGKTGQRLGFDVMCGEMWTPVVWDGGSGKPEFCKTEEIENL